MKLTAAQKRALTQAAEGKLHPVGGSRCAMVNRLMDAGLLQFSWRGIEITKKGRAAISAERPRSQLVSLTRTQMRVFLGLRDEHAIWIADHRRTTIEPLLDAGLAYESTTGWLRISPKGEVATIVYGNGVLV